ncbi:phospholipase, partial [Pseudomonas sp. L13]|nr:phospholipase [Pseudomonas sp. L13]
LWNLHTKEMGAQDDPGKAFDAWEEILKKKKKRQKDLKSGAPYASLIEFYYGEATLKDLD